MAGWQAAEATRKRRLDASASIIDDSLRCQILRRAKLIRAVGPIVAAAGTGRRRAPACARRVAAWLFFLVARRVRRTLADSDVMLQNRLFDHYLLKPGGKGGLRCPTTRPDGAPPRLAAPNARREKLLVTLGGTLYYSARYQGKGTAAAATMLSGVAGA